VAEAIIIIIASVATRLAAASYALPPTPAINQQVLHNNLKRNKSILYHQAH
jgi:hypothetical protein